MNQPVRDDEELFRIFDYARNHPEEWNQNDWRQFNGCGTTYCFAGIKAFIFDEMQSPLEFTGLQIINENGTVEETPAYVARKLGLNDKESNALFHCNNDQLENNVKEVMNDEYL